MTPQLTKIKNAGVEAVLFCGFGAASTIVTKNYAQLGIEVPLYHNHGSCSKQFIDGAGAAAEGVRLPCAALLVADQLPGDDPQKAVAQAYAAAYTEATGEEVSTFGGHAYDALLLLAGALARAGSTEPGRGARRARDDRRPGRRRRQSVSPALVSAPTSKGRGRDSTCKMDVPADRRTPNSVLVSWLGSHRRDSVRGKLTNQPRSRIRRRPAPRAPDACRARRAPPRAGRGASGGRGRAAGAPAADRSRARSASAAWVSPAARIA